MPEPRLILSEMTDSVAAWKLSADGNTISIIWKIDIVEGAEEFDEKNYPVQNVGGRRYFVDEAIDGSRFWIWLD